SVGPFKGKPRLKLTAAIGCAVAIVVIGAVLLGSWRTSAAEARLAIWSEPPGALIFVDGKQIGAAPVEVTLAAGKAARIEASLAEHGAAIRTVDLVAGVQRVELRLTKAPAPTAS